MPITQDRLSRLVSEYSLNVFNREDLIRELLDIIDSGQSDSNKLILIKNTINRWPEPEEYLLEKEKEHLAKHYDINVRNAARMRLRREKGKYNGNE